MTRRPEDAMIVLIRMRFSACSAACALAIGLAGCTADHFDYDTPKPGPARGCRSDECPAECPLGTTRGTSGQCEPACGAWAESVGFATPTALALGASRVVAVGTLSGQDGRPAAGALFPADPCSGALDMGTQPFGSATSADASASNGPSLFSAGLVSTDGGQAAALLELDAATLTAKPVVSLAGPANASAVLDAAANAAGVWVTGTSGTAPWLAHVSSGQAPCVLALAGSGEARAVGALDSGAVVVVNRADTLELQRFDDAGCTAPACGCKPAFVSQPLAFPGAQATRAADVAISGKTAFVVGHATSGGAPPFGFVLALDVDSGAVTGSAKLDLGPDADALFAAGADEKALFVAGMTGATAFDDPTSGQSVVAAFTLPLGSDAAPSFSRTSASASRGVAVAVQDSSLFVLSATPTGDALLRRCDQSGDGC